MKLYQSQLSPFASRCRILIYAKGIETRVALDDIKIGRHLNPTAKSPFLLTHDGVICESGAICEYLEEEFPDPPLFPASKFARGQVRAIGLAIEHYIYPSIRVLSRLRLMDDVDANGLAAVYAEIEKWEAILVKILEMSRDPDDFFLVGNALTHADCLLVPAYFLRDAFINTFDAQPKSQPVLTSYWGRIAENEPCNRVIGEMQEALNLSAARH